MASITTLRGRPNGSLMSLARTLATTPSTSRGAMDTRGDGGPANTASATAGGGVAAAASVHGAGLLEGSLANCTSGPLAGERRPRCRWTSSSATRRRSS
jgi:hypothetical protein